MRLIATWLDPEFAQQPPKRLRGRLYGQRRRVPAQKERCGIDTTILADQPLLHLDVAAQLTHQIRANRQDARAPFAVRDLPSCAQRSARQTRRMSTVVGAATARIESIDLRGMRHPSHWSEYGSEWDLPVRPHIVLVALT